MASSALARTLFRWRRALRDPAGRAGSTTRTHLSWSFLAVSLVVTAAVVTGALVAAVARSLPIAAGLAVGLATVVAAVLVHQHRRLVAHLARPLDALVEGVELAEQGLQPRAPAGGPAEVERLALGLARMTTRIGDGARRLDDARRHLEEGARAMEDALGLARALAGQQNQPFLLRTIATAALEISGARRAIVWLHEGGQLTARYDSDAPDVLVPVLAALPVGEGRAGAAAASVALTEQAGGLAVPLAVSATALGVVELVDLPEAAPDVAGGLGLDARRRWRLELLAAQGANALEAARLGGQVELMARLDLVSGTANRRQFVADLELEVARAQRYDRPLSVVLLDLSGLARLREVRGAALADEVLARVGGLLRRQGRTSDTPYRFGPEQFVVVARDVEASAAAVLAGRLRARTQELLREVGADAVVVACGVAGHRQGGPGAGEELIDRSQRAAHRARALGAEQVVSWEAPPAGSGEDAGPDDRGAPAGGGNEEDASAVA